MPTLQSPGLATGLDVNTIVSQLMALEQRPLVRLAEREAEYQAEISALGSLKSTLSQLQSAVGILQETTTFQATKASSSDSDVLSASTNEDTAVSSFSVVVDGLAQRHKLGSTEFNATDTFGGSASDGFTVAVGTENFSVDLSTARTLDEIRDAINAEENVTGVTAVVINGDAGKQTLVLTASETGYSDRIQVSYQGAITSTTLGLATINKDASGAPFASDTQLDAALTVEGVAVTRGSNSIDDVIDNVTLQVQGTGEARIDVTRDATKTSDGMEAFVAAYNKLRSELSGLSGTDFGGDSLLRAIESQVRSALNTRFSVGGSFAYIQEIGISTAESGDLQFASSTLTAAIEGDPEGLAALFTDSESGFAVTIDAVLERFLEPEGLIDSRVDGLNGQVASLETQRGALERRLESTEERLRAQFTALDQLVSQLQSTSSFLTQQLAGLPPILGVNT